MRGMSLIIVVILALMGWGPSPLQAKSFQLKCPKVVRAAHDHPEEYFPLTVIPGSEYCFSSPQDIAEFGELAVDHESFVCFYRTVNSQMCPVYEYRARIKDKGRSVASTLDCPEVGLDSARCEAH